MADALGDLLQKRDSQKEPQEFMIFKTIPTETTLTNLGQV